LGGIYPKNLDISLARFVFFRIKFYRDLGIKKASNVSNGLKQEMKMKPKTNQATRRKK
jgi:hypothetical protein